MKARIAIAALAALPFMATAQQTPDYPRKPIRLVVPFAPGGSTDILGRIIGAKLGESLGQQVLIDNRGGAGGTIGSEAVARSAPDGYTMLLGHIGIFAVNPTLYPALKYDPASSNAPIVLAKGVNLVALKMREVAEEHGIPVIQNPPLCRAIYKATRIGQEIPVDLYEAVAEILAFVYRLRTRGAVRATA